MTNCNYTTLSNQEMVEQILSYKTNFSNLNKFIRNRNKELYDEMVHRTIFLDDCYGKFVPIKARIFCLVNDIKEVPTCVNDGCNNKVKWGGEQFMHHCSNSCSQNDPKEIEKRKQTSMKKYGCSCSLQNPDVKKKCEQTCIERYGTDNPMESQIVQERYRQTCKERYGLDWACQVDLVKEKIKGDL